MGNNSCIGGTDVGEDGYTGYACYNFIGGTIGNDSCNDYAACYQNIDRVYYASVGDNSCNGAYTCNVIWSRSIGDDSCNGYYGCSYNYCESWYQYQFFSIIYNVSVHIISFLPSLFRFSQMALVMGAGEMPTIFSFSC